MPSPRRIGSISLDRDMCEFRVWAPRAGSMDLHLLSPSECWVSLKAEDSGYFAAEVENVPPGSRYRYRLDGTVERADPASRFQPDGVAGPSEVMPAAFPWTDGNWTGIPLEHYILYELHVGAFSAEGTFEGVIPYLDGLKRLGITAVELMPVAQFPGSRNWGYDGVFPFAAQNTYGGPCGLKELVNACHTKGLAVVLDVVYNHLGPEGNYLREFGPYFTECYRTPWGEAINLDGPESDQVRAFFIANALDWVTDFHFDALRLDAIHAIVDRSAQPFLQELAEAVHRRAAELHRRIYVIAESDLNDSRIIRPPASGGCGLDAEWSDDFHHSLHSLLTGERQGYYEDFGSLRDLEAAFAAGHVYDGRYSVHRRRRHGNPSGDLSPCKFVVCSQNHDQTGNRKLGDRLSRLAPFESLKLAAGAVILSPYLPLLFMGEEYGETAPFQYFVSHTDENLIAAVREGRRREFSSFGWTGNVPDPQSLSSFLNSKLNHSLKNHDRHRLLHDFYGELIAMRKRLLPCVGRRGMTFASESRGVLALQRTAGDSETCLILHFGEAPIGFVFPLTGEWRTLLDSADQRWGGPGRSAPDRIPAGRPAHVPLAGNSVVVLERVPGNTAG